MTLRTEGQSRLPGLLFASQVASTFSTSIHLLPEKTWAFNATPTLVTRGLHKGVQMAKVYHYTNLEFGLRARGGYLTPCMPPPCWLQGSGGLIPRMRKNLSESKEPGCGQHPCGSSCSTSQAKWAGQGALGCSKGSFADHWDSFCPLFRKEEVQRTNSSWPVAGPRSVALLAVLTWISKWLQAEGGSGPHNFIAKGERSHSIPFTFSSCLGAKARPAGH